MWSATLSGSLTFLSTQPVRWTLCKEIHSAFNWICHKNVILYNCLNLDNKMKTFSRLVELCTMLGLNKFSLDGVFLWAFLCTSTPRNERQLMYLSWSFFGSQAELGVHIQPVEGRIFYLQHVHQTAKAASFSYIKFEALLNLAHIFEKKHNSDERGKLLP